MMHKKFNLRTTSINVFTLAIFFLVGVFFGYWNKPSIEKISWISNKEPQTEIKADFSPFWKTWSVINQKYPDAEKITDQDRVYGAISGLVGSLNDPYSVFFTPEEAKSFEDDIAGSFEGIGAEVGMKDKVLTVISPLKNSPAYKAGLKAGDKILKIDNKVTSDIGIEEAVKLMRGKKGTQVVLTIFRGGESKAREIKITRDVIDVPIIETKMLPDGVFVITLSSFSANSAGLFQGALKEFAESKTDRLVLDLRGNPGGYLDSAVSMASWFLPAGKPVVIEENNKKKQHIYRSSGYDVFSKNLKFVILIDGGSASASEILAGAMQDYGKALLVGEKSFGKGSVQEVIDITPDTLLKITIAKWLTPKGISISEKGLTPDYEVQMTEKDIEKKKDPQMDKAVELLKNWPGPKTEY